MKNLFFSALAVLVFSCPVFGQYTTVNYDLGRNWFNEGQPLPAEEAMIFKGNLPGGMDMVELSVLSGKRGDLLYSAIGQKQDNNAFSVLVPYKLRAADAYDFRLDFFQKTSTGDKEKIAAEIMATMNAYLDVNLGGEKQIKLLQNGKKTVREMNGLARGLLSRYRALVAGWEPEFSELVKLKLEQLEKADLDKDFSKKDTTTTRTEVRNGQRQSLIEALKLQVEREVNQWLDTDLSVLAASYLVDDYQTEKKENTLSLNVGYGGVYLDGNWDGLTYGASPYLGLAFPLGNSAFGSKFLGNTSVTMGVFLQNFEDERGREVTGFLVDRPIYLGLDHKLFKFVRVNAGAAFLEGQKIGDGGGTASEIMVRPYVGLSARIDLSIGLGK